MNNGKICVSICASTAEDLINKIKRAENLADFIEIRFDCLNPDEIHKVRPHLTSKKTLLLTYRPKEQGGRIKADLNRRIAFWNDFALAKSPDFFVDLEFDVPPQVLNQKAQKIFSFHDFSGVPNSLEKIYGQLAVKSEIVKIAVQTNDIADSIAVWKLLTKAKGENRKIIPIAMGESGKWTRILGLAHGAFMTYATLDKGNETAPGQISVRDLIEVYRVRNLDENTAIYGILGNNTSVSLSPYIHNTAFKFHKLNAVFVPLQTHNLDEFMRRMVKAETREINLNFQGFSVTIPHKQSIFRHLDCLDETAEKIGAVNTVKIINGELHGYNTDAKGFIEPLLNIYGDLAGAEVAVLGAGGAARACVYALTQHRANVTVFARDLNKSASLAEEFQITLKKLPQTREQFKKTGYGDFDILVNTTPLGMKGKFEEQTPAYAEQLKGLKLVYDLVYVPFQTALMTEADKAEVPKINGFAMLIAQAAEQQKIWTDLKPPVTEMSQVAMKKLHSF